MHNDNEGKQTMLAALRRTLLFGSKFGTVLVVMALGIGMGLGFSALAHDDPSTSTNEAGDAYLHHACVNDQTGQVQMPDAIGPAGGDNPCPSGWSEAHWPIGSLAGYETKATVINASGMHTGLAQSVFCSEGKRPLGGGFSALPLGWAVRYSEEVISLGPPTLYGWRVEVFGPAAMDPDLQVTVRCAYVTP